MHNKKSTLLYLSGILFLTIIVYSGSVNNDFIRSWDDNLYILQNEIIKDVGFENIKTIFTSIQVDNYSPVTTLILAIEYSIAGPEPGPFHIISLAGILFYSSFNRQKKCFIDYYPPVCCSSYVC